MVSGGEGFKGETGEETKGIGVEMRKLGAKEEGVADVKMIIQGEVVEVGGGNSVNINMGGEVEGDNEVFLVPQGSVGSGFEVVGWKRGVGGYRRGRGSGGKRGG